MEKENLIVSPVENRSEQKEDDSQLILQCKAGDREAFNKLMLKYHRRIFNAAFRILGNYAQADEVAQEVFIRAYRAISGFRQEASFLTWLYTIVVNLSRNQIKKNLRLCQRNQSLDEPILDEEQGITKDIADKKLAPDKALLDKEKKQLIQKAINELEADFREVIVLRDIQLLSYAEISQILKINIGTVKSRLHRARQILQKKLKDVI